MIRKILYIGAGLHIEPVKHFSHVKEFIFTDILPRNEPTNKKYSGIFYSKDFLTKLINIYKDYNFILMDRIELDKLYVKKIINPIKSIYYKISNNMPLFINPTLFIFFNDKTKQIIRYYISTNILYNMNEMLCNDINMSDAIIVSGYFPHVRIFENFSKPKVFIGYSNSFNNIEINKDDIIYFLYKNILSIENTSSKYFSNYNYINYNSGNIVNCDNFIDFLHQINLYKIID